VVTRDFSISRGLREKGPYRVVLVDVRWKWARLAKLVERLRHFGEEFGAAQHAN
jgi:hypothetical protein